MLYVFAISFVASQSPKNVEDHQLAVSLPMPGFIYEAGIAKNVTLSAEIVTGFSLRGCTGCETLYGIYPILRGQYRYYYNFERRKGKGKNITGNSGNYVGATLLAQSGKALIGDLDPLATIGGGPVYGLQRTYKSGLYYRLESGVGIFSDEPDPYLSLILAVRIGWVIGKRR